jgi:membrane fusion protein (multidrug efflux system)
MKIKIYKFFAAAFLLWVFIACHKENHTSDRLSGMSMPIEVFVTKPGVVENIIRTPGSILANEEVELRTEIPGRVVHLGFREGTYVVKGTVLVQIDDSELNAELRKNQAQLRIAAEDEKRKKELLAIKGVSQEVYDQALSTLEGLQADIDLTNSQIRNSKIIAPFNGTIGLRYISEGAFVTTGDKIATLVQTNPVRIEFDVPEKYASLIHSAMDVIFTIAGSDKTYSAKVFAFEPMIDETSRTLKVRARTANNDGKLIPGSYADLTIDLQKINDAIMVPTQVIIPSLNKQNVFIIKNNRAKFTEIVTGIQTDKMIQITKGVTAGDTIAMTGILALKDNMPVAVSKIHTPETEQ